MINIVIQCVHPPYLPALFLLDLSPILKVEFCFIFIFLCMFLKQFKQVDYYSVQPLFPLHSISVSAVCEFLYNLSSSSCIKMVCHSFHYFSLNRYTICNINTVCLGNPIFPQLLPPIFSSKIHSKTNLNIVLSLP